MNYDSFNAAEIGNQIMDLLGEKAKYWGIYFSCVDGEPTIAAYLLKDCKDE